MECCTELPITPSRVRRKTTHRLHLHVVLIPQDGGWVAQALEYDFAAQGDSPADAIRVLGHTIGSHLFLAQRNGISDPLSRVPEAPPQYWEIFEKAARQNTKAEDLEGPGLSQPAFIIKAIAEREAAQTHRH